MCAIWNAVGDSSRSHGGTMARPGSDECIICLGNVDHYSTLVQLTKVYTYDQLHSTRFRKYNNSFGLLSAIYKHTYSQTHITHIRPGTPVSRWTAVKHTDVGLAVPANIFLHQPYPTYPIRHDTLQMQNVQHVQSLASEIIRTPHWSFYMRHVICRGLGQAPQPGQQHITDLERY